MIEAIRNANPDDKWNLVGYALKLESFYQQMDTVIQVSLKESKEKERIDLGKGFIYISRQYENSEVIQSYFARRMLNEIFPSTFSLEGLLHETFKDQSHIGKEEVQQFILSHIRNEDTFLANYVEEHLELVQEIEHYLMLLVKRWTTYLENLNEKRREKIYDEFCRLVEEYQLLEIDAYDILKEVVRENHLEDIFIGDEFFDTLNRLDIEYKGETPPLQKALMKIKLEKFVRTLLEKATIEEADDYLEKRKV